MKNQKKTNKWLSYLFCLLLIFGLMSSFAGTAQAASVSVSNFADLAKALTNSAATINISVKSNITVTGTLTIPAGKTVTITSSDDQKKLTRDAGFEGFLFDNRGTLTLTKIVLDGNKSKVTASQSLINNDGKFDLGNKGVLQNNAVNNEVTPYGGAVTNSGTMKMSSNSKITGNTANLGGGIKNNTGAVLNVYGNAEIAKNSADESGGGICNDGGSLQVYDNAAISNNSAGALGGGIFDVGDGAKIYGNAEITKNTATIGGGIHGYSKGLTLYGNASVSDNKATQHGGGISNGGVFYYDYSEVEIKLYDNAKVTKNTAGETGGGVYIMCDESMSAEDNAKLLRMYGNAKVKDNKAQTGKDILLGALEINRTVEGITVSGEDLPMFVQIEVQLISETDEEYVAFLENLKSVEILVSEDDFELLALYDIKLLDADPLTGELTGEFYEPESEGKVVTIELDDVPLEGIEDKDIAIAHELKGGEIELIKAQVIDGKVVFEASSFSLYGVIALNKALGFGPNDGFKILDAGLLPSGYGANNPEMGDSRNIIMWCVFGCSALAVLGGLVVIKLRKRRSDNI